MSLRASILGAAIILVASMPARAATFDFSGFTGVQPGNTAVLPEGTFTSLDDGLFVDGVTEYYSPTGSLCALNAIGNCQADLELAFNGLASNLQFEAFGADPGDENSVTIFSGLTLLQTIVITADGIVDFTGFSNITSVLFDDSSTGGGFEFGNFTFDLTPVPLPAALPLFAATLGVAGVAGWRKRRKVAA